MDSMSDGEDFDYSRSPSLTPLPQIPSNQGPPSVSLAYLIDCSVQRIYHELTVMSELLHKKSDTDRKISIVQFAHTARQLFIRLLAIVKWAKGACKVDACTAISCYLHQQALLFIDTADRLSVLSRETLVGAKLPTFQIPAAVDVLTLGTYPRLPLCIKTRFVPDAPIKPKEQAAQLVRLGQVIQHKIASTALPLPARMVDVVIESGMAIFTTPGEFQAFLTVLGELPSTPWTLLHLEIIVTGKNVSEGQPLVHPLQVEYLHQVIQDRMNSSARPLDELYSVMHAFCLSLQLDILWCEALQLVSGRRSETITVDEYIFGHRLVVSYWRQSPSTVSERSKTAVVPACDALGQRFRLVIHASEDNQLLPLQVSHWPLLESLDDSGEETTRVDDRLPTFDDYGELVPFETLLTDTVVVRIRYKLRRVMQKIEVVSSTTTAGLRCYLSDGVCRRKSDRNSDAVGGAELPTLEIELLKPCDIYERVWVAVNAFSGRFLCSIPCLAETSPLFEELQNKLNVGSIGAVPEILGNIKILLLMHRCQKTILGYPVAPLSSLPLNPKSLSTVLSKLSSHKLFLKFKRFDNFYLVVEFVQSAVFDVTLRYHLLTGGWVSTTGLVAGFSTVRQFEEQGPISKTGGACGEFLKPLSLVELDMTVLLSICAGMPPFSTDPKSKRKGGARQAIAVKARQTQLDNCPPYYVASLAQAVALCAQRIPFMIIAEELQKRNIVFQPLQDEGEGRGPVLRILDLGIVNGCTPEMLKTLWSSVVSCSFRIESDRLIAVPAYIVEIVFSNPPLSTFYPSGDRVPPKPKSKTISISYNMVQEYTSKNIDDFLNSVVSFAYLYELAVEFSLHYYAGMFRYISVRAFTYHRLVLGYGPNFGYTVVFYKTQGDKSYHLSLGCLAKSSSGGNPHSLMLSHLQRLYAETRNIALVMQILHETTTPMLAISQIRRTQHPLLLPQEFLETNLQDLVAIAVTPTCVRILYRGQLGIELQFLAEGRICVRDISQLMSSSHSATQGISQRNMSSSSCRGIVGLRQFFQRFGSSMDVPKAPSHNITQTTTATGGAGAVSSLYTTTDSTFPTMAKLAGKVHTPSPSGFSLASPPNLVAPSPMNQQGQATTSTGQAPASSASAIAPSPVGGPLSAIPTVNPFTPSPAPASALSNPMTPSPAPGGPASNFGVGTPNTQTVPSPSQPSSYMSMGYTASPAAQGIASPAPLSQQPMSMASNAEPPSPLSLLTSLAAAAATVPALSSSAVRSSSGGGDMSELIHCLRQDSMEDEIELAPLSANVQPPDDWIPSLEPFTIDVATFSAAFSKRSLSRERRLKHNSSHCATRAPPANLCPFERFIGCVHVLARMDRLSNASESLSEVTAKPGMMTFKLGAVSCKILLDPTTLCQLRLIVEPTTRMGQNATEEELLSSRDCVLLERYFVTYVLDDLYRDCTVVSFLKILQHGSTCRHSLLRSFINIMKTQLEPEPSARWQIELCMTVPPQAISLMPHPMPLGNPAVQVNRMNKMLFWLKMKQVSDRTVQIALPLVYDMNPEANSIILLGHSAPAPGMQNVYRIVEPLLRRQSDYAQHSGDCAVWLVARCLLESLDV